MTTTLLKITKGRPSADGVVAALQQAGIGVVEVDSWEAAADAISDCDNALVVCDGDLLEMDTAVLTKAIGALAARRRFRTLPPDIARAISHDLRTPLSAMAGWLHIMESGTLDEAGMKRAIAKLRGNIEDQVRAIERHLGVSSQPGS